MLGFTSLSEAPLSTLPAATAATGAMVGTASLAFGNVAATLTGSGALAGATASLTFDARGVVTNFGSTVAATGTASLAFDARATLAGSGALSGSASLALQPRATATGSGALTGTASLSFSGASATLTGQAAAVGTTSLATQARGTLTGQAALSGTASLSFQATLVPPVIVQITGTTSFAFGNAAAVLENYVQPPGWYRTYEKRPAKPAMPHLPGMPVFEPDPPPPPKPSIVSIKDAMAKAKKQDAQKNTDAAIMLLLLAS